MLNTLLLLTASLAALALTAPSLRNPRITCVYNPELPDPTAGTNILSKLYILSWVHRPIAFGKTQPPPGTLPIVVSNTRTVLVLQAYDPEGPDADNLILADYFPLFRQVQYQCFEKTRPCNEGFVRIGKHDEIVAYIATRRLALSKHNNGTAISRGGVFATKEIGTS